MMKRAIAVVFCLLLLINIAGASDTIKLKKLNASTDTGISTQKIIHLSDAKNETANYSNVSSVTGTTGTNAQAPSENTKTENVDNGNFLTNAVSSGITLFIKGLCNGIYADIYADGHAPGENSTAINSTATNGTGYTEYSNSTYDGIYTAITNVPHPYKDKNIVKMYGGYLNLTIYCILIFVFGALISRSIARIRMDKNKNLTQAAFVGGIATCGFALIANILYGGALDVIETLNQFITLPAMPALAPDPTSLLLCIVQTFCDAVLFVFFIIRYYVLYIAAVGCSVIAVLLVPEFTRDFAENCIEKIIRILFLQPAALFVYVVCILSVDALPDSLKAFAHIGTTLMVFLTCWYFMFGNFTFLKRGISFVIRKGVSKI